MKTRLHSRCSLELQPNPLENLRFLVVNRFWFPKRTFRPTDTNPVLRPGITPRGTRRIPGLPRALRGPNTRAPIARSALI